MKRSIENYFTPIEFPYAMVEFPFIPQDQIGPYSLEFSSGFLLDDSGYNSLKNKEVDLVNTIRKEKKQRPSNTKDRHYGRWTEEEHERLMEALELHGNTWALVEKHVGTRTRDQIRSHVQKYFQRVRKLRISEMAQTGELKKNIFVVTREYRNNTRNMIKENNIKRRNKTDLHDASKTRPKPSHSIEKLNSVMSINIAEHDIQPDLGRFYSSEDSSYEAVWRLTQANGDKVTGQGYEPNEVFQPDVPKGEKVDVFSLDESKVINSLCMEEDDIEYKEEDILINT